MLNGNIVEELSVENLRAGDIKHEYTRSLMAAELVMLEACHAFPGISRRLRLRASSVSLD